MRLALIAHDKMKDEMVDFCVKYESILSKYELYATGTTGMRIMEKTNLKIDRKKSGPLGGDQEIGSMVANSMLDVVIFFRDPLTAQAHEPDINALLRLCDVYKVALATNVKTAEYIIKEL